MTVICLKKLLVNFSFGGKHVSPRTLTSRFLGNLVCVEGIVTKCKSFRVFSINVLKVDCNKAIPCDDTRTVIPTCAFSS